MTARAFHYAKRNLFKITVELKEKYRDIDVTEENLHYFKVAAAEMVEAFQEFERTRREYEPNHSDPDPNVSILTDEEENTMSSCKRFIRLLNAKIATFEGDRQLEHEERQRTDELAFRERQQEQQRDDELALRDRQRIDELALRVRQLEADTALRQQELTSKERIELERIRLTAATQPETNHRSGLPKIELTKFSGDVTTFTEFIDSFNALVHNRSDLKANEKFHYLKSVVLGPVAKLIEGIRVTDANYQIALDLLKETYGSKPVIVTKLFDELNELKPVSWKPNDLYSFYQNVEVKFKLLENEGCNLENEIVRSVLFRKLPTSVQSELVKEKGLTFTTQDLRNVINKEAKTYIAINSFKSPGTVNSFLPTAPATTFVPRANVNFRPNPSSLPTNRFPNIRASQRLPTTHSLVTNRSQECMFCKGLHLSDDCKLGLGERKGKLVGTCYLCLKNDHLFTQCNERNSYKCSHCNCVGHHNRVLCPTYIYPPNNNNGKYRPNNNRNSFVPRQNHDQRKGESLLLTNSNVPTFANNDVCNFPSLVNCSNNIPPSPYSSQDCRNDPSLSMTTQNDPSSLSSSDNYRVYLQSATVLVRNKSTNRDIEAHVVFDSGATASYITESLVKKLGLKYDYSRDVNVYTFGNTQPKTIPMNITKVELIDKVGRVYELTVNQIPTIAGSVSNSVCPKIIENLSRTYELADKYLTKPGNQTYDLLIGNDYYTSLMRNNTIQVNEHLYLLDSVFGYLLSGKVYYDTIIPKESTTLFVHLDRPLSHEHDLRLLWDMETLGVKENATLTDDDLALQKFESAIRYENNRYYVDFPWKDGCKEDVQSNFGIAIGRLRSLVKRHAKDGVLDACKTNFDEQLKLGILERVDSSPNNTKSHYFPYHAVIRTERETTKIRVVMDASAKQDRNKPSLNQLLYRGPVLLENLCSLLLRFRTHKFGIIGDLEKAFLNIGLNESERDFTRILWLKDTEKPITYDNLVVLRHTRIPFGVTSSPFLLTGVISTHLSKYNSDDMIQKLKQDIYVDNLVTGLNNERELLDFIERSRKIFSDASLNLRAWATNCVHEEFDSLPPEIKSSKNIQSVLGIQWNTENDTLFLKSSVKIDKEKKVTKRVLLSVLSSFYDVLGLWSPVTVKLKMLIQKSWTMTKDWDTVVSDEDATLFREIVDDLDTIPNYDIPRLVGTITDTTYLELHVFSDACMYAYGATVYLRCINGSDISCNLVFAKIRISPKNITLPRLELMGALVAYRCLLYVTKSLHRAVSKVFLWSDSTCVLHWIHTRKLLPVFVKNRVNEIRSGDLDIVFKYVRTHHNPADLCRGQSGKSLKNNALWWHGPEFLCKIEKDWPLENIDFGNVNLDSENPLYENSEIDLLADTGGKEKNKIKVSSPCKIDESEFTSFSDLISHTCIVKRGGDNRAPISNIEYTAARNDWLKYLQSNHFSQTINSLESGKKDSLSINLGLELDSNGILILKGRFVEMKVDGENPFPILLPRKDHLTDIIVLDIHVKCFHVGVNQTLATLRNDYWLTSGRTEIKRILKSCDTCKMFNSKPYATPEFSSFPNYRLQKNLAFTYSAVDYFGPLYVKDGKSKSRSIWCLLFTCLTTRAIHLELVDSESSSDLLLAFRRFLARTGGCKSLLSDNAAQFQLLQKTFQHMYSDNDSHGILNENKIDFRFTPALSPWAGGCFERLISITKQCLRKTIGNITLTLCQLTTLISEIEHIINSRPLGYFGEEDFIITPNHFLGIKRDSFLPDLSSCSEPRNQGAVSTLVREWKKGNQYLEVFWLKWSSQYIQSLRERNDTKWKSGKVAHRVPKVNDVVLVRQPKKKNREMWPHGVIVKLHFGRDKQVRHVDVKLPTGVVISRPISWLYPFECDE
uniref:Integrase catalytic domain-containing protein n=1 Tax=Cacopsylla melanoneura TaxID=428564 RepID=A0A8D9AEK0_9HEMI